MQVPISLSGPPLSFLAVQQAGTPSVLPGRVSPGERQHVSSVPVPCYYSHPAAGGSVTSSSLASSAPDHAPPASDRVVVSYPPLHILAGPGGGGRLSRPSGASLPCLSAAPYSSGGERRLSVGSAHSEGRDSSADAVYAPASPCSYRAHSSSAYASQARDSGPPPPLGERRGAGGPQSRRYDAGFADRSATLSPAKDPCANNMGSPPFGGARPAYSRSGWPNPQPNSGGGRGPGGSRPQYHRAPRDVWMAGEEDRGGRTRRERYSEDEREEALEFIRPPAPTRPVGYPNKTVGGGGRGVRQRSPSYSPERRGPPPPKVSGGGRDFVTSAAAGHHSASGGRTPETVSRRLIVEDRYASKEPFYGTSSRYTEKPRETGESTRRAFAPENHARGSCHPCAFYAVGRCRNGVDCRNCHDEDHSDPHSPLFALDVLHKMGLCIVCIDFKKKGVCDDSDRVHGMLYCHHPHHCPTSQHGRVEESRGKDDLLHAGGSGVRRAVTDPPSKIRRRDDWGENYVSSSRSRQEEDCGDYMFRDSGRRRLLSCERYAPTYNPSSRSYSTVGGGGSKHISPVVRPGGGDPYGRDRGTGGGGDSGGGRVAPVSQSRGGVSVSNCRLRPPRACEERRCIPCARFFAEGRCRYRDCSRCHEPCHNNAGSALFYHTILHETKHCDPCKAFIGGDCPLTDETCQFCHDPSHMGDRSGSTKPSVARFQASPRRGGPYDGAGGRAGGAPSYRRGWEEDGGRRKEPLATCPRRGGPGLEKSSRAAAGADAADCGFGSRAGPRIQRADRGAAAVGGPHPDRCIPCLWYFQHVTGCGKGRSCTSCHHEDHRDPQSDLHPSKRLHALGRCVPCRNHFKGICPRRAEACGFCHQEEHRKALGAKESGDETVEVVPLAPGAPARRDEERKNSGERSPEGSAPQKTDLGASGPGGDEELVIASSVSGSEKTVAHGEKAEAGQEKRDQETGKSDRKGEDHRAAKAGDKNAVHYVRQRGQNEPRAHERGVCRPCSFYFIGPQGCLKRERCPDCHHADHANPHSAAHPSKLLHLKGQCRPCIPFKRGTCAKSPENCVYCHHSSHLVEGQDTASQQKQADVAESEGQPDTAEFPVQDLDDGESAAGGRDAAHDSQADLSGGLADEETLGESGRVQEGGVAASVGDSEGEEDSSTPQASKRHSVDGGIATFLGEAVGAQERKQEGQMANKEQLLESAAEPPNALDRTSPGDADALDTARAETSEAEQCL